MRTMMKKRVTDIYINNEKQNIKTTPDSYISIDREWTNNDRIELVFHYDFYIKTMPDDKNVIAIFYSPILLAFENNSELILKRNINGILNNLSVTDDNKIFQLNNNERTYTATIVRYKRQIIWCVRHN